MISIEPFKQDCEGVFDPDRFRMTEGATVETRTFSARHYFAWTDALRQIANGLELVFVTVLAAIVALMNSVHENLVRVSAR